MITMLYITIHIFDSDFQSTALAILKRIDHKITLTTKRKGINILSK